MTEPIEVEVDHEKKMITISYTPVKDDVQKLMEFRGLGVMSCTWIGYTMSAFEQWAWDAGQREYEQAR